MTIRKSNEDLLIELIQEQRKQKKILIQVHEENKKLLASVSTTVIQLIAFCILGASTIYVYKGLEPQVKNKLGKEFVTIVIGVIGAGFGGQKLYSNMKNNANAAETMSRGYSDEED